MLADFILGFFCVAAVKAGNYIPVYGEQYARPGLKYPYETVASYPYGKYPYRGLPLAGAPINGLVPAAPTGPAVVAPTGPAGVAPTGPAVVAPTGPAGPLAPGAPGGSVIFTGTGYC